MKLEEKLVSLRKEKGLTQSELAEMLQVSRQAISRWEVGTAVPSTDNLKYLGQLYDVPVDVFLNDAVELPLQENGDNAKTASDQDACKKHTKAIVVIIILLLAILGIAISIASRNRESPVTKMENMEGSEIIVDENFEFEF